MSTRVLSGVVLRSRDDRFSVVLGRRATLVAGALVVAMLVVGLIALSTGSAAIPLPQVLATLTGNGTRASEYVVVTLRLPRLVLAAVVGAALGVAGAVFQSLSRNPLGSPDIIGFTAGSATGAFVAILFLGEYGLGVALGGVLGGLATAVVVYLMARRDGLQGIRLVLVGIGVSTMLVSINTFMLTRVPERDAERAQRWLVGSLNSADWAAVLTVGAAVAVLVPVVLAMARPMAMMEMGDEAAQARGVRRGPVRGVLFVAGVALTAVATTATGPIAFIALTAPQIARRLVGGGGPSIVVAAVTGALLLALSDLAAERLLPVRVPVGITTAALGGLYLAWLLSREWRRGGA